MTTRVTPRMERQMSWLRKNRFFRKSARSWRRRMGHPRFPIQAAKVGKCRPMKPVLTAAAPLLDIAPRELHEEVLEVLRVVLHGEDGHLAVRQDLEHLEEVARRPRVLEVDPGAVDL